MFNKLSGMKNIVIIAQEDQSRVAVQDFIIIGFQYVIKFLNRKPSWAFVVYFKYFGF